MSNGTLTCRDTVRVVVRNPIIIVNAGNDTTVCNGQCALVNATAKVVRLPGGTKKYRTTEPDTVTAFGGGFVPALVDINVTNLNMTTIAGGSIASVCIDSASAVDIIIPGFPPIIPPTVVSDFNMDQFSFELVCPDGTVIMLVPSDTLINSANDYRNTCFVPGGTSINSSVAPNSGNFAPQQPFTNMNSCTANGIWSLRVGSAFGTAIIKGWSITFNDPDDSYTGNFNWNPTTNMTASNTLNPTVCLPPNSTAAYTLTVSDTAGCVTQNDVVNVTTQACCALTATAAVQQTSCGSSNGSINITPVPGPVPAYNYAWSDGLSTQANRTGLAAGAYTVTITSISTPTCTFDTTITITNLNSTLAVSFSNQVNPGCTTNNGSITVTLAGGTAPYAVTVDTGATPFTFNSPIAGSQNIPGLSAGTIDVSVTDGAGCVATATATLVAPNSVAVSFSNQVNPSCTANNGSITVTLAGGTAPYAVTVDTGATPFTFNSPIAGSQNIPNLHAGTIDVSVTDGAGCTATATATLVAPNSVNVSFSNPVNPTCAGNDGSVTVTLAGGTAPYAVTVDTGVTPFTFNSPIAGSQSIPNLHDGTVTVSVTDGAGCTSNASVTLTAPVNCCGFTVSAVLVQPSCGLNDGSIALTPNGNTGTATYAWSGGQTTSSITGVGAGNYPVTITDPGFPNCFIDTVFSLTNSNGPVIDSFKILNVSCSGNGADGSVSVYASSPNGVNVTTGFTWSNTSTDTDDTQADLATGTYLFTVTDLVGCSTPGSVTIGLQAGCCFLQIDATVVPPSCGLNNASVTANILTAGTPPYTYSIDGVNFQASSTFNSVPSGNYDVIARDVNSCSDTFAVVVPSSSNGLNVTATPTNITCFGANDGIVAATVVGGNIPYGYIWNNALTTDVIQQLAAGNFAVTVTDASGCTGSASATVTEPALLTVNLGNDTTLCEGLQVQLAAPGGFTTYLWSTTETTQAITPLVSGVYAVTVTDNNNCTASDALNVNFVPIPLVDLGEDKLVYEGESIGIFANINLGNGTGGTYNWQPDTLLSCGDCQNTVAFGADTITYVLVYTDDYGCSASDAITVNVLPVGDIYWPNAFSPNGDGNNDIFLPYGSGVKQITWQLFNRWGEKVFESNNFFYGCDGTYKGLALPMGVYVYTAKVVMLNNKDRQFKGSVTLIR